MQTHTVVQLAFLAGGISIVLFAIGATCGYQIAGTRQKRVNAIPPSVQTNLIIPTDLYDALNSKLLIPVQALTVLAVEHRTALPSSLWQAIHELAEATQTLSQQ